MLTDLPVVLLDGGAWVPWATLGAAVLLTGQPWSWGLLRHPVTLVHEGGHGTAAVLAGRRLAGIRLHSDTSGVTVSSGRPTGPGMVFTAAPGYRAPALLGLVFAVLLASGRVAAMLWLGLALLLVLLSVIRSVFGVVSVVVTGGAIAAALRWAEADVMVAFGTVLTWLLLVGGLRAVVELQRTRRAGRGLTSDADQLARLTWLGGTAWVAVFWLVAVGCLVASAWLLLPTPQSLGLTDLPLRP